MRTSDTSMRAWCEKTWPAIYRHIYRLVQNKEEAEDLTQETYLRIVSKGFSGSEPPNMGYLKAAATNLVRDSWRRKRARGALSPLEEAALVAASGGDEAPSSGLCELMARLPDEYREVLELRIVQGYSRSETALKMGKSEDSVRGLQYRALCALREALLEQKKGAQAT
ncbi:MAG: RNA polymerase sigma factor [Bacillota bacterium]